MEDNSSKEGLLEAGLSAQLLKQNIGFSTQLLRDTLIPARFGMDVAVNCSAAVASNILSIVVAELIDKTEPHELEVVVFSDTNESISSVKEGIQRICGYVPEFTCSAFADTDGEELDSFSKQIEDIKPKVLVVSASSFALLNQRSQSSWDAVKLVILYRADELLTQDNYLMLASMLENIPHFKQLCIFGEGLAEGSIEQKLSSAIHDLHYVSVSDREIGTNMASRSVSATEGESTVAYSGKDVTYRVWLEACAKLTWRIPALPANETPAHKKSPNLLNEEEEAPTDEWIRCWSSQYNQPYFYNKLSGQSVWRLPPVEG